MASYQVRQRDPLVDQNTAAMLERRGRELMGAGLIALALMFAAMLGSYSANDPGWMMATDDPVNNWLGQLGASVSSTLFIIGGLGAWGIPLILTAWGLRFISHRGEDRAMGRVVFAVIAVALASVFASTHVPGANWPHAAIGLGGLFGDTVSGAMLAILPVDAGFGLKVLSVISGASLLAMSLFVTGFDARELTAIRRFVLLGVVTTYAFVLSLAGRSAAGTARAAQSAAQSLAEKKRARREMAAHQVQDHSRYDEVVYDEPFAGAMQPTQMRGKIAGQSAPARHMPSKSLRAEPLNADKSVGVASGSGFGRPASLRPSGKRTPEIHAPVNYADQAYDDAHSYDAAPQMPAEKSGLLARMPQMIRRAATGHQPEQPIMALAEQTNLPSEDRIKARISDVIRARGGPVPAGQQPTVQTAVQAALARREPPVMGRRGPVPLIATPRNKQPVGLPPEPPVIAAAPSAMPQVGPNMARLAATAATTRAALPKAPPLPVTEDWQADDRGFADMHDAYAADASDQSTPLSDHNFYADDGYDAGQDEPFAPEPTIKPSLIRVATPTATVPPAHAHTTLAPVMRPPVVEQRRVVQPVAKKPIVPSRQAIAEAQPNLKFEDNTPTYELPPLGLLASPDTVKRHTLPEEALEENARMLESVLDDYGVKGEIVAVRPGPVVTQYELEPAPGLKASRVIGLADDIARSMSALSARVSTVPGRSVIGIELPNAWREKVVLREILAARDFGDSAMNLPLALGKDIAGEPIVANLAKMPHLLIAGTTGSGKSVAINTMILSLLYKLSPEECRLIMIDPKMLELSVYDGIPHLLSPVVTDPKKAVIALKWTVGEMEERYRKMSRMGVRNIEGYNGKVREALAKGEMFKRTIQTGFDDDTGEPVFETEEDTPVSLPYIVVVVDEMADLMMVAGKEIEACIQRLAQMARASGIHLIMATQRPSVDVITGTIKANFPTRISFQVTSKIDSRTILGEMGAEQLLGMGDMLYMAGGAKITRIHGPFVSDEEVEEIVNHLKSYGPPTYMSGVVEGVDEDKESDIDLVLGLGSGDSSENELYDQAVAVVAKDRKCSTSYIQRKLGIGYNKAAKLVEQMEENSVVTAANHVGKREILLPEH
ncbi:DNA translocase FtsK 4TM domain-containing protein [Pseudorhodobacter sp. W20_MBD10_FR17]|uniref:DNA translocase FtsK n=1 Tax=Pseudorhodobacter sp. W20_MBD10_FR17 TaxID=3240266 RepID=UPI003F9B3C8F